MFTRPKPQRAATTADSFGRSVPHKLAFRPPARVPTMTSRRRRVEWAAERPRLSSHAFPPPHSQFVYFFPVSRCEFAAWPAVEQPCFRLSLVFSARRAVRGQRTAETARPAVRPPNFGFLAHGSANFSLPAVVYFAGDSQPFGRKLLFFRPLLKSARPARFGGAPRKEQSGRSRAQHSAPAKRPTPNFLAPLSAKLVCFLILITQTGPFSSWR